MACTCRYLVCGSDSASLYLKVVAVQDQDIICEAQNGAVMDGLMTVRHGGMQDSLACITRTSQNSIVRALSTAEQRS